MECLIVSSELLPFLNRYSCVQNYVVKFVSGRWFSLSHLVSSTNKTDRYVITEILLKVTLNTIKPKYIHSQTSVPRTRMGRIPWMARTDLKVR
jgi:hypothetical protein